MSDDDTPERKRHDHSNLSIELDIDGYDVSVLIGQRAIARELRRLERDRTEDVNTYGFNQPDFDLSRFAVVRAKPTEEKWEELADREFSQEVNL